MKDTFKIYLDDERIPLDDDWILVKNFEEFKKTINKLGLDKISLISLDHDLGDTAVKEYYTNVKKNNELDYSKIEEKTGMDCCKFLVNKSIDGGIPLPPVYVHSKNPVGSENMVRYINNYLLSCGLPQTCIRVKIPHKIDEEKKEQIEKRSKIYSSINSSDEKIKNNSKQ